MTGLAVTPDGALWVSGQGPGLVSRYADGEWTNLELDSDPHVWWRLTALSDGTVCAGPSLTCFDATGKIVGPSAETLPGAYFVAPDGAVWVLGEQITRLPAGTLP